ncbi:unnamed protein product [Rotaria sp. Silwood1]|nr:unnamed protein product [Rotaria sp. Silwood1]CAF3835412.1 unnamed protein product [Rotaria sp. Silwood1]CAF3839000.1 unnamed protein product [Rotaria sp. Silwood1]CAF4859366.1 unnamed protein product [Rotaria sp. Silwood1]CAF4908937.1 unnamed protein product [Rotaria sp. Silwood1]
MMSTENQDDPTTADNQLKQCRICLDTDNPKDIISPCLCSGGSAYVHRKCLNDWRSENASGKSFKFCDVCQFEYVIESVLSDPKAERERLLKYYVFVIRDSTALLLLVQFVIFCVGFLLQIIDKENGNIKNLFPDSIQGFTVYYLSAIIILLAIVGLITLIICFFAVFSSNGRSDNCDMKGLCGSFIGFVLVCALIGLFVGIVASVLILKKIMKHHASKLWLRQEADKYVVKDFQDRREELEQYKKSP